MYPTLALAEVSVTAVVVVVFLLQLVGRLVG